MIAPNRPIALEEVAAHYDDLDAFYREIWGEHVHHGLWRTGDETPQQATLALIDHVAALARIGAGDTVCDIGSGYGAAARCLANRRGARVTALTISREQHRFVLSVDVGADNPIYLNRDWQENGLRSVSFDAAIAIESLSHMADKANALMEAARVLKSDGRLVLCVWLAAEDAGRWAVKHLLEPICSEGRLPGLATETEYRRLLKTAGFELDAFEDASRNVRRTWTICIARTLKAFGRDAKYRRFLMNSAMHNREFFWTMFRILMAYRIGAMRYGVFAAHKSSGP